MTQIFVAVPLMTLPDRLDSPSLVSISNAIKESIPICKWKMFTGRNAHPRNNNARISLTNAQLSQLSTDDVKGQNFYSLRENSLQLEMLQNTLANIKQDLSHLMKEYQSLKKQNTFLTNQLKQKPSSELRPQNDLLLKSTISSLEKQIGDLTRDNIQLKNTIVYSQYEARMQFIGQCVQKMQEQKEQQKRANQNKKTKK